MGELGYQSRVDRGSNEAEFLPSVKTIYVLPCFMAMGHKSSMAFRIVFSGWAKRFVD